MWASLSSSIFFYFSCGTENVVLAWVSSMIIFAMGAMYVFMHFCAGEGYANSLKTHIMQEQEMPKGTSEQQQWPQSKHVYLNWLDTFQNQSKSVNAS